MKSQMRLGLLSGDRLRWDDSAKRHTACHDPPGLGMEVGIMEFGIMTFEKRVSPFAEGSSPNDRWSMFSGTPAGA